MSSEVEMKDFIGIFPNFVDKEYCEHAIKLFDKMQEMGFTVTRQGDSKFMRNDQSVNTRALTSAVSANVMTWNTFANITGFIEKFWNEAFPKYAQEVEGIIQMGELSLYEIKLQKTLPGEGYHAWHCENGGRALRDRVMAWMLYLNDDFEGGETEFLYQSKRITPEQGTLLLWPAGYTHMHRGNPPLTGAKYILTGWLEYL